MKIKIFLDNNVFDFLYDKNIDLIDELSPTEYSFHIIKEIVYEIAPIPNEKKKNFIQNLVKNHIEIESYFGFYEKHHPQHMQRCSGFNDGKFVSLIDNKEELVFLNKYEKSVTNKQKNSKLFNNETDLALAAKCFSNNQYVITLNVNKGPLKWANEEGGKMILIYNEDKNRISNQISFGDFIRDKIISLNLKL